mmetsp:Transcript_79372/g.164784  ORF Transcript_79372/g.164784 Transcript_79372/m.164784 type:complete len:380 (+) Transcript_79372:60-1199(+)|eukprot:CAMPEP_0206559616 /NCGR_PEP_ID=MMETSP0325_2-20121206/20504_1 /ASSEMBLY_ACC=CAM_ASM_000347 /TAXON_ID=2866 /ORGANISM="Crypthecodinium cohnii, Strain Seligo" /LENGTH=379 /DNA_ID=CAMNT_0054061159 /DNA_START=9 /DNA_END=1148 /DNA_ORIENTATION=+
MVSKEVKGMVLMAGAGLLATSEENISTAMQQAQLPYVALLGTSTFLVAILLATTGGMKKICRLPSWQWKWVFARGFAGAARQSLTLLAISTGAPMGDISALQSVNVVVSAVLGGAILGEPMRRLHALALACSVAGAVLISKPTTLVGLGDAADEPHWFGYGLALLGGMLGGGAFIAARKLQGVDQVVPVNSVTLHQSLCLFFLSVSGLAHDPPPFASIVAKPLASFGVCVMTLLIGGLATCMMSLGGMWCPAAASSTIFTSVGMTLGYSFQILFQGKHPDVLSLCGAFLMFAAVVLMAFARRYYTQLPGPEKTIDQMATDKAISDQQQPEQEADDDESVVTFIASEFSGLSGRRPRLRPAVAAVAAAAASPQSVGLAIA